MLSLNRRYAHVPLGLVSVLLVVVIIAWLLERHLDVLWDPALRIASPVPAAVTIAAAPTSAAAAPAPDPPAREAPPAPEPPAPAPAPEAPAAVAVRAAAPPAPPDRYVLESGPFTTAEAADRTEDQLNHLGYPTIRFRKQEVRRLYAITVVGFPSAKEARRAAADLGRGTILEGEDGAELQVERFLSLGDAIDAARPVRDRGYEVRVDENLSPAVIYHVRYGQFSSQAAAEARGEELARFGVGSRVVKVP